MLLLHYWVPVIRVWYKPQSNSLFRYHWCPSCVWSVCAVYPLFNIVGDVLSGRILHGTLAYFAIAVVVRMQCGVSLASNLTPDW